MLKYICILIITSTVSSIVNSVDNPIATRKSTVTNLDVSSGTITYDENPSYESTMEILFVGSIQNWNLKDPNEFEFNKKVWYPVDIDSSKN